MPRQTRGGIVLGAVVISCAALLVFGVRLFGADSQSTPPPSVPAADASAATSAPKLNEARATLPTPSAREQAIPAGLVLIIAVVSVAVLLKDRRK